MARGWDHLEASVLTSGAWARVTQRQGTLGTIEQNLLHKLLHISWTSSHSMAALGSVLSMKTDR